MNAHSREAACIHVRAAAEEEEGLKLERASQGGRKTHTHTHIHVHTRMRVPILHVRVHICVYTMRLHSEASSRSERSHVYR